ncbi:S49 family peptidase [Halomonadaceae bacterium KBTZ08]
MSDWDSENAEWGVTRDASGQGSTGRGQEVREDSKEWRLIEKTMMAMQAEQRRSRRWGILFKALVLVYLFAMLFAFQMPFSSGELTPGASGPHTALVDLEGVIAQGEDASADNLVTALENAFSAEQSQGVVLRINSPGGSPVQADYVYQAIERLKEEYPEKKLHAVISDIGASGAYYIAAAADRIHANPSSLVGSIGVRGGGFGFTGLMDKLGVERRLYTAGENKAFLDPFLPEDPEQVEFWEGVLERTHSQFIERVRQGRGDKLKESRADLFSGLIWTGQKARELGLVDDFNSAGQVARNVIGAEDVVDYSYKPSPFQRIMRDLGSSVGQGVTETLINSGPVLR